MKKSLIAVALCSITISYATNYVVLVDQNQNQYEVGDITSGTFEEYTNWLAISTSNCTYENNWTPEDVYNNTSYEKKSICDEIQERDKNTYTYKNGQKVLISTEKESRSVQDYPRTENLIGTKKVKTCLEVLNSHGSVGNGNYILTVNNSDFSGYCDMSNGGWTLAMHLKNSGQLSNGSMNRDNFWNSGSTMTGYTTNTFTQLELSDTGFLGWDRIKSMTSNNDLNVKVTGVNSIGNNVDQEYTLNNFAPNMTNTTMESSSLSGGGLYTISKKGDTNTKNGWGTCGTTTVSDGHIGIGICPKGLNTSGPFGTEVQVWHYGAYHGNYSSNMNVSFGNENSGNNSNYHKNVTFDFYLFIK